MLPQVWTRIYIAAGGSDATDKIQLSISFYQDKALASALLAMKAAITLRQFYLLRILTIKEGRGERRKIEKLLSDT